MDLSLFSVFFFVLCHLYTFVRCLNEEGIALLSFKQAINQDPLQSLTNWNSSDQNPCSWNGITCKNEQVVSISMPKKGLEGSLPHVLGSLPSLRHINLRNNKLHGSLPVKLFDAKSLQSLVLYGNGISGYLPFEVGNLRYLQVLDLSLNLLNGSIPVSLILCKRLKTINLSHNDLTYSLPVGFGTSLIALEKLDLSYNRFNGSIPSDIGNLPSVQGTVDLSHNLFSGTIPASLGNVSDKVYIDISYNNLSGSIPQSGTLMNRGPAAFVGNLGLCGPPLNKPCSSNLGPTSNVVAMGSRRHIGLSRRAFIAIVASDIVALCLIGLVFVYCMWKIGLCKAKKDEECCCFKKENLDNFELFDLVPLDSQVGFSLDELMKASAFVLGKGATGIVYKVVFDDGLTLAVRRLGEGGLERFKEFRTEVEIIGKLRHPNVVTFRAYYWSFEEKLLIYDYIPNGNLATAIHGNATTGSFSPLPWPVRLKIIKAIAEGLAYLHQYSTKKYSHGNLKPTNILLGVNMEPYISDFGLECLSNIVEGSSTLKSNLMASKKRKNQPSEARNSVSFYQPPEAQKSRKPSQKWDIYSFGVVLLELISGRSPMDLFNDLEMDLVRWVQFSIEGHKLLSDVLDPSLSWEPVMEEEIILVLKIALACVQANAERRPSMRHVCHILDRLATDG